MKIYISTFGCKVNQYESQIIFEQFLSNGFSETSDVSCADVLLVNSCTVTEESSKKIIRFIHKSKSNNPKVIVALFGCMAQAFPESVKNDLGIDIILGTKNKFCVLNKVLEYLSSKKRIVEILPHTKNDDCETFNLKKFHGKTRAFVKIQDGCNQFCSYCIIPYARGNEIRSKSLNNVFYQTNILAKNGYKEIVLVGINVSMYGKDFKASTSLCDAIEKVSTVSGIERIRLGSLDPQFMNTETIKRLSSIEKLCDQFHLSLQSGCNKTLRNMNRKYTTEQYYEVVNNIRKYFINPAITTDVMVGFPGETDDDFSESLNFLQKIGFYRVHVFPYSERKGTRALNFPIKISQDVKKQRCKEMIAVADNLQKKFLKSQQDKTVSVLFEKKTENGFNRGHTKNYVPVVVNSSAKLEGNILEVKIKSANGKECEGTII